MQTNNLTPLQIRQKGLEALLQALGPVGMVRFLQQFDPGSGDYSRDRAGLLENATVEDIVAQIQHDRDRSN